MPNITYSVSNDIEYYDAASGETVVYNLGDIAWYAITRSRSFQWFFWGYSLAFSDGASAFIGDLKYFALKGVLDQPSMGSTRIPALVFCVYQLMFAAITPMLALGGFAERCRLGPVALRLEFCTAALAISIYLGKRSGYGTERLAYKPHNTTYVVLGTVFLWFGWFGFNGGSALSANLRAAQACIVTNLAASVGGLTWMLWDYRLEKKWSVVGFCSGAISGLVAITPASGYVGAPAAVAFGVVAGTACNFATQLKFLLHYDECLDVFASHGIGGMVGNIMTALFAQSSVAAFDGFSEIPGGWFDHHYIQLGYQIADSLAGFGYSFVMTTLICWIFHFIPFLCLRTTEAAEALGMDDAEMGEFAYDYVGLDAEHGFPSERGALPPISGAAANHELGSGVGGREGPHQRISADKGRGSVGSSNEKIRG
ncbi:ammonium transporter [Rhizoctonia solani]|uniref:Ammonium transporter n=1 Tax=Rhizoctonia solani TaxID=456999 RepID=A0A8H8P1L5_9AGAM|nr:ammonium transporter [Rhizoctonia solani]QRW23420.1 ammonium transporter [Rhizoctonia solani]